MRNRLILISILLLSASLWAQTTTITGTIDDLTVNPVTSGKVVFTLKPSVDTTISGNARFTPGQPVTCYIQSNGTLMNATQTGSCVVVTNTSLTPAGTSYRVDICPYMACSSSFNFYAINSSYNISTIVPTPTTGPAQNFADVFSNQVIAGNKSFTGATTLNSLGATTGVFGTLNNVEFADQFTGTDCGAKINSADTTLGATHGEIWVNQNCGLTWSTAVSIGASHVLRFVQGGTYSLGAGITLGANSTLSGSTGAMATNTAPSVMLQMANGANLASLVTVNSPYVTIQDLELDGNNLNNPSSGSGIVANSSASRLEISRVTVGDFHANGVELDGTPSPKIFKLMAYQNTNDGLYCNNAAGNDAYITDSEFESNQANGIEINGCAAWRILHNDFGGDSQALSGSCGLKIYGNATYNANFEIISNNQFGSNYRNDLCINGYNTVNNSVGSNIIGNSFIGSLSRLAANTYSELVLVDGGLNAIYGNVFSASGNPGSGYTSAPWQEQYAISITDTGHGLGNRLTGNVYIDTEDNGGSPTWGTARLLDSTVQGITCLANASIISISTDWGTSATLNGATGYLPNCSYLITSGSGAFSSSPKLSLTYPGSLLAGFNGTPVCTATVTAITGSGGAILFNPTTVSATGITWTAQTSTGATFTPAALETYKVALSCGP